MKPPAVSSTTILFVTCLLCVPVYAQTSTGLEGTVTTEWTTPVADATVTLSNAQTGAKLTSSSKSNGDYSFPNLAAGQYDLSATSSGFKPYTRLGLQIGVKPLRREIRLQLAQDDVAASVRQLEIAVAAKPDDYMARFNLGRAYLVSGNLERATIHFGRAFQLQPASLPALVGLTQLSLNHGDFAHALDFAQAIRRAKPENTLGKLLEAECYLRLGRIDDSRQSLNAMLNENPTDVDALLDMGVLEMHEKHYEKAEIPFRRAYAVDPSNLRGIVGLAEIAIQRNEPDKAVQIVAAEVEKQPQRRDWRSELAIVQAKAGQYDKAIAGFQSLLDQYKDFPTGQADLYARMGEAYARSGDYLRASDNLKKAVQLAPDNFSFLSTLGSYSDRAGKKQDALAEYRAALKLQPHSALLLNNIAYLMTETGGNLDEALDMAQQARRQMPDFNEILDTIGWIYFKKDLIDSATRVFEELVEKYSNNPTYHFHYAMALAQRGDRDGARKELNAALQNNPGKSEEALIREMLKKLS